MPVFIWEAVTKKDEVKKGEMEAVDEAAVRGLLRRQGFKSIEVKKNQKIFWNMFLFYNRRSKKKMLLFLPDFFYHDQCGSSSHSMS